ncbi:MAG: DUF3489 domain-containing protein [Sulfurisoma sp.]|nr:DUF3489 domain-containing protein [Sulfurisoma sp.]
MPPTLPFGRKRKVPAPVTPDPEIEAVVSAAEASWAQDKRQVTKPRTRENSKQAAVIQMLQRPDGTTIQQIMESTGWQAHTVRGTFAESPFYPPKKRAPEGAR